MRRVLVFTANHSLRGRALPRSSQIQWVEMDLFPWCSSGGRWVWLTGSLPAGLVCPFVRLVRTGSFSLCASIDVFRLFSSQMGRKSKKGSKTKLLPSRSLIPNCLVRSPFIFFPFNSYFVVRVLLNTLAAFVWNLKS